MEKGELLAWGSQLINVRRIRELKGCHWAYTTVIIVPLRSSTGCLN